MSEVTRVGMYKVYSEQINLNRVVMRYECVMEVSLEIQDGESLEGLEYQFGFYPLRNRELLKFCLFAF